MALSNDAAYRPAKDGAAAAPRSASAALQQSGDRRTPRQLDRADRVVALIVFSAVFVPTRYGPVTLKISIFFKCLVGTGGIYAAQDVGEGAEMCRLCLHYVIYERRLSTIGLRETIPCRLIAIPASAGWRFSDQPDRNRIKMK